MGRGRRLRIANAQWGKLFEAKIGLAGEVGFGGVADGGDAIDSHISQTAGILPLRINASLR